MSPKSRKPPKRPQPRHYTLTAEHGSYALTGQPVVLTTATLTKTIAPVANDPSKTPERLSAWTRRGLLEPIGKRFPGTGAHRIYLEDVLPVAAVLTAMADKGEPTTTAETHLQGALALVRAAWNRWKAKRGPMSLVIEHWTGRTMPRVSCDLHEGPWKTYETSAASVTFYDLNVLFALVVQPESSWEEK
jgi:hypothetical protein